MGRRKEMTDEWFCRSAQPCDPLLEAALREAVTAVAWPCQQNGTRRRTMRESIKGSGRLPDERR